MYIPQHKLAIEVDGPTHFDLNGEVPLGRTLMKRRHLRALGFNVVSVSYREWAAASTVRVAPTAPPTESSQSSEEKESVGEGEEERGRVRAQQEELLRRKLQEALREGDSEAEEGGRRK
eukprot:1726468-Rhodomonas_salina.2